MKRQDNELFFESGVSEAIGFILLFGIMTLGIALVTLYGYPMLLQEQQNTNVRNMERNMIVIQNDLNSLTYKIVPYKETTLQVAGGTMSIQKEPEIGAGLKSKFTVDIDGVPQGTFSPGEINYNSQDGTATISLENGAVHVRYWSSPTGSAMLAEPRWFYDEPTGGPNTFVMSFITLNASDDFSQTAIGTVRMKLVDAKQTTYDVPSGSSVTVKYEADNENNYNIAWRNYFNSPSLKMQPVDSDAFYSTFILDPDVEKLVIKTYNVTILSL